MQFPKIRILGPLHTMGYDVYFSLMELPDKIRAYSHWLSSHSNLISFCTHLMPVSMQRRILHHHISKTLKNVTDRPPVHMKAAHFFPADFQNGRVWKRDTRRHMLETASCEPSKMTKTKHVDAYGTRLIYSQGVSTFLRHESPATSFLPSNFKPFSNCLGHHVNCSSNFATITFFTAFKIFGIV